MKLFCRLGSIFILCILSAAWSRAAAVDLYRLFVRAELDRNSAYLGQQVILAYRFYVLLENAQVRINIKGIQLQESPPPPGFWVEDLEIEGAAKREPRVIDGREYQTFVARKRALFATTTGKLKIPSNTFAVSAMVDANNSGIFNDDQTLYCRTLETMLDVKPLPTMLRPSDFTNAVGSFFKLTADIDKTQAVSGENVSLRVKLEGCGNLKMIPDIPIPPLSDVTIDLSKRTDKNQPFPECPGGGEKTWEYALVAGTPGRRTIPSLAFSYFNAAQEKYETVTTPPLSINVVPRADGSADVSDAQQNSMRRGSDVSYIKRTAGSLKTKERFLYQNPWFYLPAALSLALNAGALFYQRRRSRLADNAIIQSRRAQHAALTRIQNAEKEGRLEPRRYYDGAAAALSAYLCERFHLAEIELTSDSLDRALSGNSARPEIIEEIKACLQECDFGRFVSASNATDKRAALSERIRRTIDALGEIMAEKARND
jgi:hypothetical protein